MAGTTANLAFPYPTGGDPAQQGDDKIKALADALDAFLVGADAAPTYATNYADSGEGTRLYRSGLIVVCSFYFRAPTSGGGAADGLAFTVPVGYRPIKMARGQGSSSAGVHMSVEVSTAGVFRHNGALAASALCYGTLVWRRA